jgi:hypothetical protein
MQSSVVCRVACGRAWIAESCGSYGGVDWGRRCVHCRLCRGACCAMVSCGHVAATFDARCHSSEEDPREVEAQKAKVSLLGAVPALVCFVCIFCV